MANYRTTVILKTDIVDSTLRLSEQTQAEMGLQRKQHKQFIEETAIQHRGSVFDEEGDGYWGVARNSSALHVAAWRLRPAAVKLLLARGARVNLTDSKGRTPLALAVRASVDSYWTELRSPELVQALLEAGSPVSGVLFPSGDNEIDRLLQPFFAKQE